MDHAPVVAVPPTLAPDNVIGEGLADRQIPESGPPAIAVIVVFTVTVTGVV